MFEKIIDTDSLKKGKDKINRTMDGLTNLIVVKKGTNLNNQKKNNLSKTVSNLNGELYDHPNLQTTDYIEVEPNTTYSVTTNDGTKDLRMAEYDNSYTYITGRGNNPTWLSFTSSATTKYVRIAYPSTNTFFQLSKSPTPIPYEEYSPTIFLDAQEIVIKNDQVIIGDELVKKLENTAVSNNLINPNELYKDKGINLDTGKMIAHLTYTATGFIAVKPNSRYTVSTVSNIAEYDINKTKIKGNPNATYIDTLPNTAYVRFHFPTSTTNIQFNHGTLKKYDTYKEGYLTNKPIVNRPYLPIKWIALGDSITEGKNEYPDFVSSTLGLELTNSGYAGASMAYRISSADWNPFSFIEKSKTIDFKQYDLVTISYGTNDWANGDGLGEIDSIDENTVLGALNNGIKNIYTSNPKITIILLTPIYRSDKGGSAAVNSHGLTLREYTNGMIEVCNKYSIASLNMLNESGINEFTVGEYLLQDGLHPTITGAERISKAVIGEIKKVLGI